jgi:hypothetical protein
MGKALLVAADLSIGKRLLDALDSAKIPISVALWFYSPEYEDWRFVLASRRLDQAGLFNAYGLVHDALEKAGVTLRETPSLLILGMNDPFIRELRRAFAKTKSVEGMRLGNQLFGDRFIEDSIVYRIR